MLEISPRSFSIRVREGSRLNQIRFRNRSSKHKGSPDFTLKDHEIRERHAASPLVDGDLDVRDGLIMRVSLCGTSGQIVGYRAQKNGDIIESFEIEEIKQKL